MFAVWSLRVEKLSGGRVGCIYVRDPQQEGQNRQFRAQYAKPGLIIDERWNSGGQIPDRSVMLRHGNPGAGISGGR